MPVPLGPESTVVPSGSGSKVASANDRKSARWMRRRVTAARARRAQDTRTGISRYRKSSCSAPRTVAGRDGSAVSMITSSLSTASTPSIR